MAQKDMKQDATSHGAKVNDEAGTRTLNLLLRRQTPYPLGHNVNAMFLSQA